jgi:hypothetical protein
MASKARLASLSLFAAGALALPAASTGNATVRYQKFAQASLVDSYDASNWLDKFDVQNVSDHFKFLSSRIR